MDEVEPDRTIQCLQPGIYMCVYIIIILYIYIYIY